MMFLMPSNNLNGADNEQGSPLEDIELAWLAGLMDGEGWIGIARAKRDRSPLLRYTARTAIATTSPELKDHLMKQIARLGLRPFAVQRKVREMNGYKCSAAWNITTGSNIQTKVLLNALLPYLVEKKRVAELTLEYINWRESQPRAPGAGRGKRSPQVQGMKDEAERIMELLRNERHRNRESFDDPSTTTRLAPVIAG